MKVIEPGKFVTSLIRCPKCEALLEINAGDVSWLTITDRFITCEECKSTIFVKKNDDDTYEVINKED
jgi:DNA-directed RNA polymerase subunit RPC12/RpoP